MGPEVRALSNKGRSRVGTLSTSGEDEFRFKGEGNIASCLCVMEEREEEDGRCMIIRRVEKK